VPPHQLALAGLVGGWRWILRTQEGGTTRTEAEQWRLRPHPSAPTRLVGRYLRTVEVHSDDRTPFRCNQRAWYRQRATFDVEVELTRTGYAIHERAYRAEPSPCDTGFRRLTSYAAARAGERLQLTSNGAAQTLWQVDAEVAPLPEVPWPLAPPLAGAWRWDATSFDGGGHVRDESEWWELSPRADGQQLDATYRRRVTVRSADGSSVLPCARAPRYAFDDAYVLTGRREGDRWRLVEVAAQPGHHPCLAAAPARHLDEATAEQRGEALVLEWRGKRRQVLHRRP
jgi:hypothetical protein